MFRVITIFVLMSVFLTGCVSTQNIPISEQAGEGMSGATLLLSKRELPGFAAMTAGKAMFGGFGAVAMIGAGNDIVRGNNIADPAVYISETLIPDLSKKFGLKVDSVKRVQVDGNSSSDLAETPFDAEYLLDIQTVNWSFAYFPTDWETIGLFTVPS